MNEIQFLKKMISTYKNPASETAYNMARDHLNKVHKKYGTVEISTIQNLIK
jgi:hypothetical protein